MTALKHFSTLLISVVLAFALICFGFNLQRAAYFYAQGKKHSEDETRLETLKALYSSVDWSAKIEKEYKQRLAVEKKLEAVCKKSKLKVCL